jgi:hypothetical protein
MMRLALRTIGLGVLLSSTAWAQPAEGPNPDQAITDEGDPDSDEATTDEGNSGPGEVDPPQQAAAEGPGAAVAAPDEGGVAPDASTSEGGGDGPRFRFGVAAGAGLLSASDDFGNSASGTYYGLDLRFGAQISDLIGVYACLSLGATASTSEAKLDLEDSSVQPQWLISPFSIAFS